MSSDLRSRSTNTNVTHLLHIETRGDATQRPRIPLPPRFKGGTRNMTPKRKPIIRIDEPRLWLAKGFLGSTYIILFLQYEHYRCAKPHRVELIESLTLDTVRYEKV